MPTETGPRRRVHKLFVGYRTRLADGLDDNLPEFKAPANWKDEAKIKAEVELRKSNFLASAKDMPYTGTFDEVVLIDSKNKKTLQYKYHDPAEGKPTVAVRVRNYLLKNYPDAWGFDTHGRERVPQAIVVGFDPRTFLKILGLECSLPSVDKAAPLGLWYTNSDHRDVIEAVMPKEFAGLTLPFVLKYRRPVEPGPAAAWDDLLKDWPGPGVHPDKDAKLAVELASQLGFFEE